MLQCCGAPQLIAHAHRPTRTPRPCFCPHPPLPHPCTQANRDASRANLVRLNLKEAREALVLALEEVSPAAQAPGADAALAAAVAEAELLLADVAAVEVAAAT